MDNHRKTVDLIDAGQSFAVAVVLCAGASTPQKAGARAVIEENGRIWGTLGGGLVEAEARRRSVDACQSGVPTVFDFLLDGTSAAEAGVICGGSMRVLIDPTAAKDRVSYTEAADALARRRRGVLITTVRAEPSPDVAVRWLAEDDVRSAVDFPDAGAIAACLADQSPRLFSQQAPETSAPAEIFVEPVIPKPLLLIAGGGHVGQALARQAALVGFDVVVIDDRPEFAAPALFPEGITTRCGEIPREIGTFPMVSDTYIVIVTRGHEQDAQVLAACIDAPVAYLGMIGSRRKVGLIRKRLLESGLATESQFDRVHAPIGLDIGAVTVPEIATSITAELIAVRRKAVS